MCTNLTYPELNNYNDVWEMNGEEWRDVVGHEGKYQVSNYGRVRRLTTTSIGRNQSASFEIQLPAVMMLPNKDTKGYPQVGLSWPRRVARVHRIVAEAFLPAPSAELLQECRAAGLNYVLVNHKDKNPANPNVNNLEWCSPKYNMDHSKAEMSEGIKSFSGSKSYMAILDEKDVLSIVEILRQGGISQQALADQYGVKQITISNIWTGRSWAHLTGIPRKERSRKARKTKAIAEACH